MLGVSAPSILSNRRVGSVAGGAQLPRAVHTDGDDAYLIGSQSNQAGLVPVYLFPDCQCALSSETLYPAEEYYRLREILRNDPSAFDDQCDLFRSYPLDWYKELALTL